MGIEHIPGFRRGQDSLDTSDLNAMVRAIPRVLVGGNGTKVRRFGDRIIIETDKTKTPKPSKELKAFKVISIQEDILLCSPYIPGQNTNPESELTAVAKPHLLQFSPWHGKTVRYGSFVVKYTYQEKDKRLAVRDPDSSQSSGNSREEIQTVTPPYFIPSGWNDNDVFDVIIARPAITKFYVDNDPTKPVVWEDINTGGRQWAVLWSTTPEYGD